MLKVPLLPDELKKLAEKVSEHDQLAELLNNDVKAPHENINNNFKSDNVDENLKEIGKMTLESNENMKKMEKELFEVKNMEDTLKKRKEVQRNRLKELEKKIKATKNKRGHHPKGPSHTGWSNCSQTSQFECKWMRLGIYVKKNIFLLLRF